MPPRIPPFSSETGYTCTLAIAADQAQLYGPVQPLPQCRRTRPGEVGRPVAENFLSGKLFRGVFQPHAHMLPMGQKEDLTLVVHRQVIRGLGVKLQQQVTRHLGVAGQGHSVPYFLTEMADITTTQRQKNWQ